MVPENWDNLKEIFSAAIALAPSERLVYLDKACGENLSLRAAVESLLKSHEDTTNFVDEPAYKAAAEMILRDDEDQTGRTIAHYRIRSLLGAGGMGKVYLAEDEKLKRNVALKVLPSVSAGDEAARNRLLREARAAAALDHPNICAIHEVGDVDGTTYIAMQYVDGETLDVRLKQGPLKWDEALLIATQIADGLLEAHSHRLVHRDIKPANIIINSRGQVKVLDFGLAKIAREPSTLHSEAETETMLSTPGLVIGTLPYMSPEQVKGEPLDQRSDIFSYGVVLYEMLSGKRPFCASNPAELISSILANEPSPLRISSASNPVRLEALVAKCLKKETALRYQTMEEVVVDLKHLRINAESVAAESLLSDAETQRLDSTDTKQQIKFPLLTPYRVAMLAIIFLILSGVTAYSVFIRRAELSSSSVSKSAKEIAYDDYLKATVFLKRENPEDIGSAIKFLEQAVAADPALAVAWADLGRAYSIKGSYFGTASEKKQLNVNAEMAVAKALDLNPDLAEAHFARGLILWTHENGFPHEQAIQSFKSALTLNPKLDEAHHQLGVIYLHIGLLDKASAEIAQALALNPANNVARFRLAPIYIYQIKYEEAFRVLKSIPTDANPPLVERNMATALFQLGRTEEASAVVEKFLKAHPNDEGGTVTSVKAMLLAQAGKQNEAEEAIQRAVKIGEGYIHFHHTAYNIASAYAIMNRPTEAVKWLETAADDGFPCYPFFEKDANLNSIRKDQQFISLMLRLRKQWEQYKSTL